MSCVVEEDFRKLKRNRNTSAFENKQKLCAFITKTFSVILKRFPSPKQHSSIFLLVCKHIYKYTVYRKYQRLLCPKIHIPRSRTTLIISLQ